MTGIEQALQLAVRAHAGQVRKTDNTPYIIHPVMVAHLLTTAGATKEVVMAALLHDVLEDTTVTRDEVLTVAGQAVVDIIDSVTEDKTLPWEERKAAYVQQVVAGGESVWLVSVADKIHNAESLLDYIATVGDEAWSAFNRGKESKMWFEKSLHEALGQVWQHPLLDTYGALITQLEAA